MLLSVIIMGVTVSVGLIWFTLGPGTSGTDRVRTDVSAPTTPTPTPTPTSPTTPSATTNSATAPATTTRSATPPKTSAGVPVGGTGTIRSVATGQCIDSDSNPTVSLNGTPLGGHAFAAACNGTGTQQWREGPTLSKDSVRGGDWYRLLDQGTGFCLDSNTNSLVYTLPCLDPDDFQIWKRETPSTGSVPSGTVVAYRNRATDRCLSLSPSDSTLRTQPCPTNGTWPKTMLFQRRP